MRFIVALAFMVLFFSLPAFGMDNESLSEEDIFVLEDMDVTEHVFNSGAGVNEIPREMIKKLPKGGGSVTELLGILPGVQFDEKHRTPTGAGEITPADISISGGKSYENLFLIDGMSNSSLLNPGATYNPNLAADVTGNPQKFFIDTWLVEDITVYDSNISAKYDGFAGGVVDMKTKLPAKTFSGNLNFRTTRSEWTRYYLSDEDKAAFEQANRYDYQPRFHKEFYTATVSGPLGDNAGYIASYDRKESVIPMSVLAEWKYQTRLKETYFLKGVYNFTGSSFMDISLVYDPYEGKLYIKNTKDSEFTIKEGGYFAALNYVRETSGKLSLHADFSHAENSRRAPKDHKLWTASPLKPWGWLVGNPGSGEGGFGSIDKDEDSITAKLDYEARPFALLGTHNVILGALTAYDSGRFNRLEDSSVYNRTTVSADIDCGGDTETCSDGDQFFTQRYTSPAVDLSLNIFKASLYAEDEWKAWRLKVRGGLRGSYDDYMENFNLSPRTRAALDLFGSGGTVLTAGYNRYYSANLMTFKLKEAQLPYIWEVRDSYHNVVQAWRPVTRDRHTYRFSSLKTPYKDEYTAALEQNIKGSLLTLKYLERYGGDEFALTGAKIENGVSYRRFNNNGKSFYRSAQALWKMAVQNHIFGANLTWQESSASNSDYEDILNDTDLEEEVVYNGKTIKKSDLPKENFNRPWTLNASYVGKYFEDFTLGLTGKYKSGYRELLGSSSTIEAGCQIDPTSGDRECSYLTEYEVSRRKYNITVDSSLSWEKKIYNEQKLKLALEVNNLFDRKNEAGGNKYELGRQFWLEVNYEF